MRTATITKIKGLSIQTQQNTFVLFTLFKLTLDERNTLTKIPTRKTSHNHSKQRKTSILHFAPDQIKSSKKNRRMLRASGNARVSNAPPSNPDTPDEDILIGDQIDPEDDSDYPVRPDKLGFYTFFLKGEGNLPDLLGIEDDQLLAIQNNLHERLKARDEARERAISKKLHELEQKHEFTTAQYLKHFAQVSELLEPTAKDAPARVKLADKMLMLLPLFDGEQRESKNLL